MTKTIKYLNLTTKMILIIVCLVIVSISSLYAQSNEDYFKHSKMQSNNAYEGQGLIHKVEEYHLSRDNFWRKLIAKDYNSALYELKYTLKVFPNHPKALELMGLLAKITDNRFMPIPFYQKAIQLFPQHAFTYAQFGLYLYEIGNTDMSIEILEKARKLNPDLKIVYIGLAKAYYKNGKKGMAAKAEAEAKRLGHKDELFPKGQN